MVACAKVIVFFGGLFCCFFLAAQKHYKNRFFDDFEMLIFSFFGQKSRVNNLATVGSITWPHFLQKNWKNVAKLLTLQFSRVFLLKLVFVQKSHSPCRKKNIFEKQKNNKKQIKKRWPSY